MRSIDDIAKDLILLEERYARKEVTHSEHYLEQQMLRAEYGSHAIPFMDAISGISLDRLRELCEAERDGRNITLPCKVGDTVYCLCANRVIPNVISDFWQRIYNGKLESWFCVNKDECETFDFNAIGKTVFLTKEAAEAAKKEMERK